MAGFFKIVIDHHKRNRKRAREFDCFKACMAAAALVAIADGHACERESAALKALVRTLEELKLYDTAHGMELYEKFVAGIETNPEEARTEAMETISVVKSEPSWAALLVAIAMTMSEADGVVVASEVESINEASEILGIDPDTVRAFEIEARNEMHE